MVYYISFDFEYDYEDFDNTYLENLRTFETEEEFVTWSHEQFSNWKDFNSVEEFHRYFSHTGETQMREVSTSLWDIHRFLNKWFNK